MTVPTNVFYTDWLVANGVNKNWGYDFPIFVASDARVQVRDGTDDSTIVEYTNGFTLNPTEDDFSEGYILYPSVGAALAVGKQVRIVRTVDYLQTTEIGKEGNFSPDIHERVFDRLTMMIQQISNAVARSIVAPLGETGYQLESGITPGKTLIITPEGKVGEGPSGDQVSAAQAYAIAAGNSATAANTSAGNAATSETNAFKWASNPEDVEVTPGLFSAFHWYRKTLALYNAVITGIAGAIHGAAQKTPLVSADEFGFWDSVSGALRKITFANLIASIFNGVNQIANGWFNSDTFRVYKISTAFYTWLDLSALTAARKITMPNSDVDLGNIKASDIDAVVIFNGQGTVAIIGTPRNVSSVTDLGVGVYRVNLAVAQADTNYLIFIQARYTGASANTYAGGVLYATATKTTTQFTFVCQYSDPGGTGQFDSPEVMVMVVRPKP